jgi:superfamily I DNA/RNA helicase
MGLPADFRPPADYDIPSDYNAFRDIVQDILRALEPPAEFGDPYALQRVNAYQFIDRRLTAIPLNPLHRPENVMEWGAAECWSRLLSQRPCVISFDMVKRLGQLVLELNPLLLKALRMTYTHIFLDEFQDTTYVQFELLTQCFKDSSSVLTAVGDNKQRIMLWANAIPNAFERFEEAFSAQRRYLLFNYRSDPKLVGIQQSLIAAIDPDCEPPVAAQQGGAGDAVCEILAFPLDDVEAQYLADAIKKLIDEGKGPREVCLLARIQPARYCQKIIAELRDRGIRSRIENDYQDLMNDQLVRAIMSILHIASEERRPECWSSALELSCLLHGVNMEDDSAIISEERRLTEFLQEIRPSIGERLPDVAALKRFINQIIIFYGHRALRAHFPMYANTKSFAWVLHSFSELLWKSYESSDSWKQALAACPRNNLWRKVPGM